MVLDAARIAQSAISTSVMLAVPTTGAGASGNGAPAGMINGNAVGGGAALAAAVAIGAAAVLL